MAKAVLVSLLLVACVAAEPKTNGVPKAGAEPNLLNTGMLYQLGSSTKDLTVDVLSYVGTKSYEAVSPHTAPVEKIFWEQYAEVQKLYKQHAKEHVDKGLKVASDVYATVLTTVTPPLQQAYALVSQTGEGFAMQANALIDAGAANFEKAHPERKGSIPKDFGSRMLLLVYLLFVIYIGIKVALFVLKKALGIFCYIICCGACLKRSDTGKEKASAGTKNKAKPGKPATQPAPKKGGKK